jgi:CHAT domain-containing protein
MENKVKLNHILMLIWLWLISGVATGQQCGETLSEPLVQFDNSALIAKATQLQAQGTYLAAIRVLNYLLDERATQLSNEQIVLLRNQLGDAYLATQQLAKSQKELELSLKDAPQHLQAQIYNNLGNLYAVLGEYIQAQQTYDAALALTAKNTSLYFKLMANKIRTYLRQNDIPTAVEHLHLAAKFLLNANQDEQDMDLAFHLLTLSQLALQMQVPELSVYDMLQQVIKLTQNTNKKDEYLLSYAYGYLGQLYEQANRHVEAMQLTHRALFLAQEQPNLAYRWEWQRGRLLAAQDDDNAAISAYKRALAHLQPIKSRLMAGQRDIDNVFSARIKPVYFGLSDLLLRQASLARGEEKQRLLMQAIENIEQLKVAELQNHFQDECVTAKSTASTTDLNQPYLRHTAVFYPVLLADRTELLLNIYGKIHQISVDIDLDSLQNVVLDFQKNLQIRTQRTYLRQAWQLYDWLIRPLENLLINNNITTIVFIPDGILRAIPISALHDKKQFLIEKWAIATTPSLDLTRPQPLPRDDISVLLSGLSQSVQGFAALPNVPSEIQNISKLFSHSSVLMDEKFSIAGINNSLQQVPYVIIHIASHGKFGSNPQDTFLLTYDDKITMNRLENMLAAKTLGRAEVELLTLSACQTAVGDERAALGLAGVAIKAGAHSALASLWFVNDMATSMLITEFYRQVQDKNISKAEALRHSQLHLMQERDFKHPLFWAPFLLIGNWL